MEYNTRAIAANKKTWWDSGIQKRFRNEIMGFNFDHKRARVHDWHPSALYSKK
jgi:hypothetical protein